MQFVNISDTKSGWKSHHQPFFQIISLCLSTSDTTYLTQMQKSEFLKLAEGNLYFFLLNYMISLWFHLLTNILLHVSAYLNRLFLLRSWKEMSELNVIPILYGF